MGRHAGHCSGYPSFLSWDPLFYTRAAQEILEEGFSKGIPTWKLLAFWKVAESGSDANQDAIVECYRWDREYFARITLAAMKATHEAAFPPTKYEAVARYFWENPMNRKKWAPIPANDFDFARSSKEGVLNSRFQEPAWLDLDRVNGYLQDIGLAPFPSVGSLRKGLSEQKKNWRSISEKWTERARLAGVNLRDYGLDTF